MKLTINCDNLVEGHWFRNLSPLLSKASFEMIRGRSDNQPTINRLIEYDRPDIILQVEGNPVLVVEKTREVPTGHNIGQRSARLVRAAEEGVSTIKFLPFDAMKHGDHASVCHLNIRLIKAFQRMAHLHDTPVLAVNWPCDQYHELVDDGSENERMALLVHDFLQSGLDLMCEEFENQQRFMEEEYERRLRTTPNYANPPPSVRIVGTEAILNRIEGLSTYKVPQAIAQRPESVIYTMYMTPAKCDRQDPYTGMQFIYDYIWCRDGPKVEDKHRNLFLHFPKIPRDVWEKCNPNDISTKSSNWYLTANALVFADDVDFLRE